MKTDNNQKPKAAKVWQEGTLEEQYKHAKDIRRIDPKERLTAWDRILKMMGF